METVFNYTTDVNYLQQVGIAETSESDYLERVKKEKSNDDIETTIALLFDLSTFFNLTDNQPELLRIESLLKAKNTFVSDFNE